MKKALEIKTVIAGRYEIESVTDLRIKNQISYLCVDLQSKTRVLLKEFYPEYAQRDAEGKLICLADYESDLEKFKNRNQLAKKYSSLPTVICVYDIIAHNNTCYAICEYVKANTVEQLVATQGVFSFAAIQHTLSALLYTNKSLLAFGLCHKSFRPDNILITKDGYVKINELVLQDAAQESLAVKDLASLGYYMLSGIRMTVNGKFKRMKFSGSMKQMAAYLIYLEYCPQATTTVQEFLDVVKKKFNVDIPSPLQQWYSIPKNKKKAKWTGIIGGALLGLLLLIVVGTTGVNNAKEVANQLDTTATLTCELNGEAKELNVQKKGLVLEQHTATMADMSRKDVTSLIVNVQNPEGTEVECTYVTYVDGKEQKQTLKQLDKTEEQIGIRYDLSEVLMAGDATQTEGTIATIRVYRELFFGFVSKSSTYEIRYTSKSIAKLENITYSVDGVVPQNVANFTPSNGAYALEFEQAQEKLTFYPAIAAGSGYTYAVYADAEHTKPIEPENGGYTVTLSTQEQIIYIVVSGTENVEPFTYTISYVKNGCDYCGEDHPTGSCKCATCGSTGHTTHPKENKESGATQKSTSTKCATCGSKGHTTANHSQEKKEPPTTKCELCDRAEHTTADHPKCEICGSTDHTKTEHQCTRCKGDREYNLITKQFKEHPVCEKENCGECHNTGDHSWIKGE